MKDVDNNPDQLELDLRIAKKFVGRGIKFLREKHGITQQNLEWYSGVQQNIISTMESGKQDFKIEYLVRIAAAFNLNLVTFFEVCLTVPR